MSGSKSRKENTNEALHLSGIFAALRSFPRPVIALVDGPCFGGGVGIISSCDMAFACPMGRYNPSSGKSAMSDCLDCPAGRFLEDSNEPTNHDGVNDCTDCAVKYYNPNIGEGRCFPCRY